MPALGSSPRSGCDEDWFDIYTDKFLGDEYGFLSGGGEICRAEVDGMKRRVEPVQVPMDGY